MNILFAIDTNTEEVIVSESSKGSKKINFIERIGRQDNVNLFKAVEILTNLSSEANLDTSIFKAVDKVSQMIYKKHKETK
jgi:hypothetical protein